jgi:hypothetical protein
MDSIRPYVPPTVSLMCTDCEGSWPADWLLDWEFTTCPNCGGELRPPTWMREPSGDLSAQRRSHA